MGNVLVHPHALKHGLSEESVRFAWQNFVAMQHRRTPNEDQIVAIGYDQSGKMIQMIGVFKPYGTLVYHALTPPTTKALIELGLLRRPR